MLSPELPEDLRRTGERLECWLDAWQLLMRSDREIAMRRESIHDAQEHALLKRPREVGERDIAAENKIEEPSRRVAPHVLVQEFDALSMLRLYAVEGPDALERFLKELWRQLAQTRWLKASSAGATKDSFIDVGRHD